jgi:hypothetical protein
LVELSIAGSGGGDSLCWEVRIGGRRGVEITSEYYLMLSPEMAVQEYWRHGKCYCYCYSYDELDTRDGNGNGLQTMSLT